jgi:two-component system response regulator AtoC
MADRILIVDDDDSLGESLELLLASEGCQVVGARDAESALELAASLPIDVILCDADMSGLDDFDLLPQLSRVRPGAPVIVMSKGHPADLALEAMKRGAWDYLSKPLAPSQTLFSLRKARDYERSRRSHEQRRLELERCVGQRPIVAASRSMIDLLELVDRTSGFKTTALLVGERGTGKEVLARTLHGQSPRRREPFVAVECGAPDAGALERELFGHAKKAFAGAERARRGLFAEADRGTLFLDEVDALSPILQTRLLQALREEEIRPIGSSKPIKVDVRVIASTASDIEADVEAGRFDADLFQALNVIRLEMPSLRQRLEDIPLLCDHFLGRFRNRAGKTLRGIDDDALQQLVSYSWPGNVRELENVIERAVILSDGDRLTLPDLAENVSGAEARLGDAASRSFDLRPARRRFEADFIRRALRQTDGNRTHAARLLAISHRALLYKLKEYAIRD